MANSALSIIRKLRDTTVVMVFEVDCQGVTQQRAGLPRVFLKDSDSFVLHRAPEGLMSLPRHLRHPTLQSLTMIPTHPKPSTRLRTTSWKRG